MWLRKKKDLIRLLMLVVVEVKYLILKKDRQGVYYADDYLHCRV